MAKRRRRGRGLGNALGGTSKKDYIAIGNILCRNNASPGLVSEIASYFASDNPAFKSSAFTAHVAKCKR